MIKASKLADYAVVLLSSMARNQGELYSSAALARQTHVPEPTVAKLLKVLSKAQIVDSVRGSQGGYRLNALPDRISIAHVIEAIDGPIAMTACVDHAQDHCELESICGLKGRWNGVNIAIRNALENIKLSDMHVRH